MNIVIISGLTAILLIVFLLRFNIATKGIRDKEIMLPYNCLIGAEKPSAFINFLCKMVAAQHNDIRLNFCNVKEFTYESYLVICAQAEKARDNKKKVFYILSATLSMPIANMLMIEDRHQRTFHQHIVGEGAKFIQHSHITPELINSIEKELKRIGIRDYYGLNTLVTEIIGNAIEHGIRDQNINWWMHHKVEKNVLKLVFVDMGLGIISSYRKAKIGCWNRDETIIKDALNGKIGSSTKKANRGKGLPQIDQMVQKKFISNFILITNTITLRYINGEYVSYKHSNFVGTYISLTVNKENFSKWQKSLT